MKIEKAGKFIRIVINRKIINLKRKPTLSRLIIKIIMIRVVLLCGNGHIISMQPSK